MTLIVAAIVQQSVVLAADSRVDGLAGPWPYRIGEKVFVRDRVGILTSGDAYGLDVPTLIRTRLSADADLQKVIEFMRFEFTACGDMHSIVGGLDSRGQPKLFKINAGRSDELIDPVPRLWKSFGAPVGVESDAGLTYPSDVR